MRLYLVPPKRKSSSCHLFYCFKVIHGDSRLTQRGHRVRQRNAKSQSLLQNLVMVWAMERKHSMIVINMSLERKTLYTPRNLIKCIVFIVKNIQLFYSSWGVGGGGGSYYVTGLILKFSRLNYANHL